MIVRVVFRGRWIHAPSTNRIFDHCRFTRERFVVVVMRHGVRHFGHFMAGPYTRYGYIQ